MSSSSSYPVQPYSSNVDDFPRRGDRMESLFSMANRMMNEMLNQDGFSSSSMFSSATDGSNPNVKVFGVSSMNVTQISRGPDGRPRVVQAHDERRMGPGGVWQTKKVLKDPDRGIDKMQVGYFVGDQGEIVERHLDPRTGQYREEVQRRGLPAEQWRVQARQAMERPLPPPPHQQQQQLPPYDPYAIPQALPPTSSSSHQYY